MTSSLLRRHRARPLLLSLLFLATTAAAAAAQGILFVRVSGDHGPVVDATVDVLIQGTRLRRLGTNANGAASFAALPAGTFDIAVEALGYERYTQGGIRVDNAASTVVEVTLEPRAIDVEGLTVSSERIQIQRENTEFSTQVDEKAIELLPVTYNARDLVALTPGARAGNVWGGSNFQANNYRIDGLSANHPGMGGDLIEPNINWIERVEVRGLGAGAEYGGFQGGLIDIVTKRGDNDFHGMVRTAFENGALNSSNLLGTEIGTEVTGRYDVEGEVQGPLIRDKLFYYASAKHSEQDRQALNHLRSIEGRYTPAQEGRTEEKLFGKLTWAPTPQHQLEVSGAYLDTRADNFGITGYEAPDAAHRYSAPTWLVNGAWRMTLGPSAVVEARVNHFSRDERYEAYQGEDVPGIRTFALFPPYTAYGNNPFSFRSAPSSTAANVETSFRIPTGDLEHVVRLGVEYTRGSFINNRIRNGGVTWQPVNLSTMDPTDPSTWSHRSVNWVASQWGGEVRLDADITNASAYAQSALALGSRVVLSPGLRWNQWQGWLTPWDTGERFQAVKDQAADVRMGLTVDLVEDGSFVAKAHWGRYHQDMISQMFDRAQGGNVFTNEEIWYYRGDRFTDPTTSFTEAERDALAQQGLFTQESVISLNESGPVEGYKQPYIDQWLVGLEKQFGRAVKIETLYTRRKNHNMIALVDRNAATNYTKWTGVRVYDSGGQLIPYGGGSLYLKEVYLPNNVLRDRLIFCHFNADSCENFQPTPGLTYADVPSLTWNPDMALTTAPGARREFSQFQFTVEVALPAWGASFSVVTTDLVGDLDNVSGYTDPDEYDAGPYVRVNEGVNALGKLENFADIEGKVSVWGNLPLDMRGGAFWTYRTGDHYSPRFRLSGLGIWQYRVGTGALGQGGKGTTSAGQYLDWKLFGPLEGHEVFVGPRGLPEFRRRANVDLHLERSFELQGRSLTATLDAFNVLGDKAVTELQTMVNNGKDYYPDLAKAWNSTPSDQFYRAPLERVAPRSLRFGLQIGF